MLYSSIPIDSASRSAFLLKKNASAELDEPIRLRRRATRRVTASDVRLLALLCIAVRLGALPFNPPTNEGFVFADEFSRYSRSQRD